MDILLLFLLVILNGIFVLAEMSLLTVRKARMGKLIEDGDSKAILAVELGENPNRFLSAIQIGITSIGILNGIVGESVLAAPISKWLTETSGIEQEAAKLYATVFSVVIITYLSIVIGELVPKRLGQANPETFARIFAKPMNVLAMIARPAVIVLSSSTEGILKLFGVKSNGKDIATEEEIHAMLDEVSEAGVIEQQQRDMVRNVFRLDDRQIGSFMVPRSEVVCLNCESTLAENLDIIRSSDMSRFPVCRGSMSEIVGIVSAKDLLLMNLDHKDGTIEKLMSPPVFVPDMLTGMELLERFMETSTQMVFVIDEYGEVQGLVTIQDIMEAVTGEFKPIDQNDASAIQREDGSWLFDGLIPIPELKDSLGMKEVPEEDKNRYHTLGGMIMWLVGRIPKCSDVCEWDGWRFEILDMDGKRIDKVLASKIPMDTDDREEDTHS